MRSENMLRINQFNGLNTEVAADTLNDFQLVTADEWKFNVTTNEIVKREAGFVTSLTGFPSASTINGNFTGIAFNPVYPYDSSWCVATRVDGKITFYRNGIGTVTTSAMSAHTYAYGAIQYNGYYYVLEYAGIYRYALATFEASIENAILAGSPGAIQGIMFKERMFIVSANITTPARVYYSATGDPTSWPGANFIDVLPQDGYRVLAVAAIGSDKLLIFKENCIHVLYIQGTDTATWQLKLVSNAIGVNCYSGVYTYENVVYFTFNESVYATDGINVKCISNGIENLITRYTAATTDAYASVQPKFTVTVFDRHLLIIGNYTLVYSLDADIWYKWSIVTYPYYYTSALINQRTGNVIKSGLVLFAPSISPVSMYTLERGATISTAASKPTGTETVNPKIKTKAYDFDAPEIFKRIHFVSVTVKGAGTVNFKAYTTDNATPIASSSQSIAETDYTKITVLKFKCFVFVKSIQFEVEQVSDTTPFTILEINCAYSIKDITAKVKSYG